MIETQMAQIAAAIPSVPSDKEKPLENVKAVTTRGGKSTRDPPNPNHAAKQTREPKNKDEAAHIEPEIEEVAATPKVYTDTTYLPFPTRARKQAVDEQFSRLLR